ncbi:hypothetical protein, partial [Streptomyces sp. NPDC058373]|uniref:hypothetical protein n=1 Tax=Streptomyces sp. NPDC058373 TaxID=3346465 RepID=UPI0036475F57
GHKPLWEFLAEFLAPEIRLAANSLWVYAGPLTRPLVWRVNLPGGKFRVVWGGVLYFAWRQNSCFLFLLGRWRGLFLGFGFWCCGLSERWCAPVC